MTKVCENPDILNVIYIFKTLITIAVIVTIVLLVIFTILDIIKMITSQEVDTKKGFPSIIKRIIACIMVFLLPSLLGVIINLASSSLQYGACIDNANKEFLSIAYATEAEKLLTIAEKNKTLDNMYKAQKYINRVEAENLKSNMQSRLDSVKEYIKTMQQQNQQIVDGTFKPSNNLNVGGFVSTGSCKPGGNVVVLSSEPDPSCAINYWSNVLDASKFIYPKSETNQKPLGAWPTNYRSIPTQISVTKTYQNGNLIWPVTPSGGVYKYGYYHNGIDIAAPVGTPLYSPVNGTLDFSSWGQTENLGTDETAYTVGIIMDKPMNINGQTINKVFLTHLSGLIYRCTSVSSCNMKVKQGQLIGYIGTAQGAADVAEYAPHLHMSFYKKGLYDETGLKTDVMEKLYGIKSGDAIGAGK